MFSVRKRSGPKAIRFACLALVGLLSALLSPGCSGPANYTSSNALNYFAYVVNAKDNTVSQYRITDTGALTPLSPATIPTGSYPAGIATRNGNQTSGFGAAVYVINQRDSTISQFRTDPSGLLVPLQPPTVSTGKLPTAMFSDGGTLFVASAGDNTLSLYDMGTATGALKFILSVPTGRGPSSIAVHSLPNNELVSSVYVTNRLDNTISQYIYDGVNVTISAVDPATVATGPSPIALLSPKNKNKKVGGITVVLASGSSGAGSLSLYSPPTDTGAITLAAGSNTIPTGAGPSAATENGFSAVVVNTLDNSISLYDIDIETALITPLPGLTSLRVGNSPTAVAFSSPRANVVNVFSDHLYVTNAGDNTVSQFQYHSSPNSPNMFSTIIPATVPTGNFPLGIATIIVNTNKLAGSGEINATIK